MTYATMLAVAAGSCAALSLGAWLFLHSERFGALPAGDELDASSVLLFKQMIDQTVRKPVKI